MKASFTLVKFRQELYWQNIPVQQHNKILRKQLGIQLALRRAFPKIKRGVIQR